MSRGPADLTRPAPRGVTSAGARNLGAAGALCGACLDDLPSASDPCARPDCPHASLDGAASPGLARLSPRTPTRPSLVDGPRAEVVAPREAHPAPHIGTRPSLPEPRGRR